jgi:hypothetical protein
MLGIKMCANVTDEQKLATRERREEFFAALHGKTGPFLPVDKPA